MSSPLEEAALLGLLQGLTEFLPVSSSGHLALAQTLFGVEEAGLLLTVVLHAGTLLATVLYFRQRLAAIVWDAVRCVRARSLPPQESPANDVLVVAVASVPTGLMGLTLHDHVERFSAQPLAVGLGFTVTALLLGSCHFTKIGTIASPSLQAALLIGLAQGAAIFPGISRSGATIVVSLWLGIRSDRAFELSMLLSIPAIVGAVLIEVLGGELLGAHGLALFTGALVAAVVGLAALTLLRRLVSRGRLVWFNWWVVPLALATLAMARAWPENM